MEKQVKYCQVVLTNHCHLEVIHQLHQPEEIHLDRIQTPMVMVTGIEEEEAITEKHLNPGSLICSNPRNICLRRSHLLNVQKRIRVEVSSKVLAEDVKVVDGHPPLHRPHKKEHPHHRLHLRPNQPGRLSRSEAKHGIVCDFIIIYSLFFMYFVCFLTTYE